VKAKKLAERARRRPGRPTKLNDELADRLVLLVEAGVPLSSAATTLGVTARTIQLWRARAYSTRPQDRPHVELERRLQRALGRREAVMTPWEASAAALAGGEDWLRQIERDFGGDGLAELE
jgi:hypothetical protein